LPEENDLEGHQDQGGKHGGQAGMPKPIPRPKATERDEDVIRKGSKQGSNRRGAPARERRSTDFIVPLGYCQLTSVAFFEFQIYTANQREGASPQLARS
jgi:hypothetical protein